MSNPITWNNHPMVHPRMRLFLNAYRFWILYGGPFSQVAIKAGIPLTLAIFYRKNISRKFIQTMDWYRRPARNRAALGKALGTNKRLAKRVRKLERGQVGKEFKVHDVSDSTTIPDGGTVTCLNLIAQGDQSLSNREGLEIDLQSINARFKITSNDQTNDASLNRIIIFSDRHNQGVLPLVTELLEAASEMDFKEHDENNRFRIYYDKTFTITPMISEAHVIKFFKYYKRFKKPLRMYYKLTTAAQAAMSENSLYMLHIGDHASNLPNLVYEIRITYTD